MLTEIINPPESDEEMLASYVDKIRDEVKRAADNWLHIAYYVYELNYFGYYKSHYDSIVDCCLANFGFKKSTTYNFINIVEQFSVKQAFTLGNGMVKCKPKAQYVGWVDFFTAVKSWSYSQLVAMLSLSEKQREQVSPEMSAREIKRLKTDSKRLENESVASDSVPADDLVAPDDSKRLEKEAVVSDSVPADVCASSDSKRLEKENVVSDFVSADDLVAPDDSKRLENSSEADELRQSLENALDEICQVNSRYDSKCRELQDMITARDVALHDLSEANNQIKKLKADLKKVRAELKALKVKST